MKRSLLILLFFSLTCLNALDLTIHYHRYEGDYEGWGLHLWNAVEESGGTFIINEETYSWWEAYPFSETDDYGVYAVVPILYEDQDLGFIVHKGEEKDPPGLDRFFGDYATTNEIWLLQGIAEIFYEEPSTDIRMMSAFGDGINTITVHMTGTIENYTARFQVFKEGVEEPLSSVTSDDDITIQLNLVNTIDITVPYEVTDTEADDTITVIHQFPEDEFIYEGDDLGFTWSPEETVFKLWSPAATTVNVLIYETPSDPEEEPESYPMTRIEDGVLSCTVPGDLKDHYYMYEITLTGVTREAQDPYSKGISTNSTRSLIFDHSETDPPGWEEDESPVLEHPCDAVIYEVHIRDLSINETWNGDEDVRGKYLGMIASGTTYEGYPTGLDHLVDLGVNCVQILPMYDFGSVDETDPMSRNWGYDPMAYNCPEGSYSSDPSDITRITEMKSMIKGLHDAGLKVIMDVVYNHTYYSGDGSFFDQVVPNYYYYLDETGGYANWTGTGNTINSFKPMVRRFILESVKYWVSEYHIDGFRFDLMGLTDPDLMEQIVDELQLIKPDILVYGEPWGGFGAPEIFTGKGDQRSRGFGCFNDNIRNGIRGDTDGFTLGYPMGNTGNWSAVQRGVMGSIYDFTDGPSETINYLSAHDNYTWYDKLVRTVPEVSESTLEDMNKMGMAIVMTSQGVAFMHAGSEFMRTKRAPGATEEEVRNSYNANDDVNKLDWARKADYIHINDYYKGLIALRKLKPEFRLQTADEINAHLHMYDNNPEATMTFILDDISPGDSWGDILVSYNPNSEGKYLDLPEGVWTVVVNNYEAGTEPVTTGTSTFYASEYGGSFYIAPYSALVMFRSGTAPGLNMSIFQNPGLENYLHFAINVSEEFEEISLSVNDADLMLEQLEGNSWIADFEITSTGNMQAILTVDDYNLIRNFAIGSIGNQGGFGRSYDGNVTIEFPAGSRETDTYFTIFHKTDVYEIGKGNIQLNKAATVKFLTEDQKAVYRLVNDQWQELPTVFHDGYVTAETERLGEFRLGEAINSIQVTNVIGNYPNPFNPETEINFEISALDNNQNCTLEIYNIKGQLVRTLWNETLPAGKHKIIWNGKDNSARTVASGVYFFSLNINSRSLLHKMLLLK